MIEVTMKEAREYVDERDAVVVLLEAEGTHAHMQKEMIDKVEMEDVSKGWAFLKVDIIKEMNRRVLEKHSPLYFESDVYPVLYIYYKQERKVVVNKLLSNLEVIAILTNIEEGTFKLV
jgi:GTP-binding protein EngB required for normal cell division